MFLCILSELVHSINAGLSRNLQVDKVMRIPKTKKGVIYRAYKELERLAKRNKKSIVPYYDFKMWARFSVDAFHELFVQYESMEFESELRPIAERTDLNKSFETDNLIWVEHQVRTEILSRDVIVADARGRKFYFTSASVAEQEFRFPQGVLCRALRIGKSYKGWKVERSNKINE